jgi:GNAT superfamily N-acetyltransferase
VSSTPGQLDVRPLTPRHWPAFAELLDAGGPAGRCWCMAPRIGADYRRCQPEQNKTEFRRIVEQGPPPGLLAFEGETAVGWVQVTPRSDVAAVERAWRLRRVDDVPVWLISCFYIRKGVRRRGVMAAMIDAAVEWARSSGAPAIEACPLDGSVSPSATSIGYASTYAAAGFVEIARRSPERPIMRLDLTSR